MPIKNEFITLLKSFNIEVLSDISLSNLTTFKIGGNADYVVKPKSFTDIINTISALKKFNIDYYFLGNGSNILASDDGYNGAIILTTSQLTNISLKNDEIITCEAGANLSCLCTFAKINSLSGIEFAFGIPGSVGGAVFMNAGAYGGEIKDVILSCTFLDEENKLKTLSCDELDLSYRHSIFTNRKCCILKADFKLIKSDEFLINQKMQEFLNKRISKQPLSFPSAGSTFKRPQGNYASALIEQCGLKGKQIGGAMVSEKHSGFIINAGGATCKDVLDLVDFVKDTVYKKTNYKLECEIKTLGF